MKDLPKKCLTCKYMDFVDDDLKIGHCFEINTCDLNNVSRKVGVKITRLDDITECVLYKVSRSVIKDASQGCW